MRRVQPTQRRATAAPQSRTELFQREWVTFLVWYDRRKAEEDVKLQETYQNIRASIEEQFMGLVMQTQSRSLHQQNELRKDLEHEVLAQRREEKIEMVQNLRNEALQHWVLQLSRSSPPLVLNEWTETTPVERLRAEEIFAVDATKIPADPEIMFGQPPQGFTPYSTYASGYSIPHSMPATPGPSRQVREMPYIPPKPTPAPAPAPALQRTRSAMVDAQASRESAAQQLLVQAAARARTNTTPAPATAARLQPSTLTRPSDSPGITLTPSMTRGALPPQDPSYIGPVLHDPAEINEFTEVANQRFEVIRDNIREDKIRKFHTHASNAEVTLARELRDPSVSFEIDARLHEHQNEMLKLQEEMEDERRKEVDVERKKLKSEIREKLFEKERAEAAAAAAKPPVGLAAKKKGVKVTLPGPAPVSAPTPAPTPAPVVAKPTKPLTAKERKAAVAAARKAASVAPPPPALAPNPAPIELESEADFGGLLGTPAPKPAPLSNPKKSIWGTPSKVPLAPPTRTGNPAPERRDSADSASSEETVASADTFDRVLSHRATASGLEGVTRTGGVVPMAPGAAPRRKQPVYAPPQPSSGSVKEGKKRAMFAESESGSSTEVGSQHDDEGDDLLSRMMRDGTDLEAMIRGDVPVPGPPRAAPSGPTTPGPSSAALAHGGFWVPPTSARTESEFDEEEEMDFDILETLSPHSGLGARTVLPSMTPQSMHQDLFPAEEELQEEEDSDGEDTATEEVPRPAAPFARPTAFQRPSFQSTLVPSKSNLRANPQAFVTRPSPNPNIYIPPPPISRQTSDPTRRVKFTSETKARDMNSADKQYKNQPTPRHATSTLPAEDPSMQMPGGFGGYQPPPQPQPQFQPQPAIYSDPRYPGSNLQKQEALFPPQATLAGRMAYGQRPAGTGVGARMSSASGKVFIPPAPSAAALAAWGSQPTAAPSSFGAPPAWAVGR